MEKLAIVVDTNVVFAALIRPEGVNKYALTIFPEILPFYYPEQLKKEILKYRRKIAVKSGISETQLIYAIQNALAGIKLVKTQTFAHNKHKALNLVYDPKDWAYVALALFLRNKYEKIVILTWNKKDFKEIKLEEENIFLATPEELFKAFRLRYERKEAVKKKRVRGLSGKIYRVLISVLPDNISMQ